MRDVDLAAIVACCVCGVLVYMRAELGRQRLVGFPDLPWPVRGSLYLLTVMFVALAWRIFSGYGEADLSEVLLYATVAFASFLVVALMIRRAWSEKLSRAPIDAVPTIKQAVREAAEEAVPDYLKDLAAMPADYERRAAEYRGGAMTPTDPTIPQT